jgi:hypothetical protein
MQPWQKMHTSDHLIKRDGKLQTLQGQPLASLALQALVLELRQSFFVVVAI